MIEQCQVASKIESGVVTESQSGAVGGEFLFGAEEQTVKRGRSDHRQSGRFT